MKPDKRYRVERVTSREAYRPYFTHVHLDVEKRVAVATNGMAMAVVPVEVSPSDRTGPLPAAAVATSRKREIQARKRLVAAGDTMHVRPTGVTFPDWTKVVPEMRAGDKGTVTVCLSPRLLMALTEAIGADSRPGVLLTIPVDKDGNAKLDPIVVQCDTDERAEIGVLMPCRWGKR